MRKLLAAMFLVVLILVGLMLRTYRTSEPYSTVDEFLREDPIVASLLVGEFVDLSVGRTHWLGYSSQTTEPGLPVIFVHGYTGSVLIWEPNLDSGPKIVPGMRWTYTVED